MKIIKTTLKIIVVLVIILVVVVAIFMSTKAKENVQKGYAVSSSSAPPAWA